MEVWVVKLNVYNDLSLDNHVFGVYSSLDKADKVIKEYDLSKLIDGTVVKDEYYGGNYCHFRKVSTDNETTAILQVKVNPIDVDDNLF